MKHARKDYDARIVDLENKIPIDEPVFLLRGQDQFAPRLLLMYATEIRLSGGDELMARNVEDHAQSMIRWQSKHGGKYPDLTGSNESRERLLTEILGLIKVIESSEQKNSNDLVKLNKMYSEFYGEDNPMVILFRTDLKEDRKYIKISETSLEDFNLIDKDLHNCNLVVYIDQKQVIFLKNTING